MNLHVAIIKKDDNDFEKYYNKGFMEGKCDVFSLNELCSKNGKCVDFSALKDIQMSNYDYIIVFEYYKIIPFIKMRMKKGGRLILWNWNLQNKNLALKEKIVSFFCEIWTFDEGDAIKYKWKLNNQFYFPTLINEKKKMNYDQAFCICLDKRRYYLMQRIREKLLRENVKCDFLLIKDNSSTYLEEDKEWILDKTISYGDVLDHIRRCNIIIDLVQENQKGITIRTLEALFYEKKLITNNKDVRNYSFYNSSNILIWDVNEKKELSFFLKKEYQHICSEIKKKYTLSGWLEGFGV